MTTMNGWPKVAIGELLKPNEQIATLSPTEHYREVTVRLWGKGVVLRREVTGAEISGRRFKVSADQFIMSRIDARNGAMGVVPLELDGAIVTNDFPTFNTNRSRLLPAFLGWLSKTPDFVDACRSVSEGTTNRVRLKEVRFLKVPIPLPPLEEQQRIVSRIDRLAAKIDEANELNRRIDVEIAALSASLHFSISKDRRVPMNSLIELSEDRVPVEPSLSYPQIGIRGFGGGLFGKPPLPGGDTTYRHFNRLSAEMLVLSQVKGWEGAIGVCPQEFAGFFASPEYRTFRCIEATCDPEYLDMVVRAPWFRAYLQEATHGQGARRERTRPEQFLELVLPMPELEDQKRAARVIAKLKSMQPLTSHVTAARSAMLPSILDRAFRGEL
jgi:type I restriction enzyme, S subunit